MNLKLPHGVVAYVVFVPMHRRYRGSRSMRASPTGWHLSAPAPLPRWAHAPRGAGLPYGDDRWGPYLMTARRRRHSCYWYWAQKAIERRRPRMRKQRITYRSVHEAGHAVGHLVFEQPFDFVYLRATKKTFGQLISCPPADCTRRTPKDPVVVEFIEHMLIIDYAGGAAERLFFPSADNRYSDAGDLKMAERLLRKHYSNKEERDAYRQHCRDAAWKLVNKHRRKIEKVAAALERWRVLTDYEVNWLINKPRVFAKHERDWPKARREATWHETLGWWRLDRSHHWHEERRRQREDDAFYDEETGDFYG